jgi:hypothetical protein
VSVVHDRMHRWLEALEDDHIDEDYQEIPQGRHTVTNHLCTVRGKYQGRPVVATFSEFFNTASATAMTPAWIRNILDVFVAEPTVKFEGIVRRKSLVDKIVAMLGIQRGAAPCAHALFGSAILEPEGSATDTSEFGGPAFCSRVLDYFGEPALWKLEFQAGSGVSSYYSVAPARLDTQFFQRRVEQCITMLAARGGVPVAEFQ